MIQELLYQRSLEPPIDLKKYSLKENENGIIIIYDLMGREMNKYKLVQGETILNINEENLLNGMYMYRVMVNDKSVYAGKVIISK